MVPPRQNNHLWALLFTTLGCAGLWLMRIEPSMNDVPIAFEQQVETAKLGDGSALRTSYTGIGLLDHILSFLVLAFAAGPLGLDPAVRLQQLHFLLNFFSFLCIWNIEAYRPRNARKSFSFPGTWAIFYQTVAGAAVVPWYYAAWVFSSASEQPHKESDEVPMNKAKIILPSAVFFYLLPTLVMYLPQSDPWLKQGVIAYWQVSPVVVSMAIPLLSVLVNDRTSKGLSVARHLQRTYVVAFGVSALVHFYVLLSCYSSLDPQVSLYRVFVPERRLWKDSLTTGLHYIFQWDWWAVYAACLLGPGAAMAGVWSWKEDFEQGPRTKTRTA
ncbi:hypothetical protein M406DRAFT_351140 [Cryphonectria parasitica EP155]|uniref:Uncharacterized protein n=1 Tax=Cryphonectria parasitica (strain ATCC 38755 / EP155) TaxID=660469 RepID=A0A9P4Y3F4_CRYP1|nr:uncharacterized protein M406DRAFT_351140 [Cryphonectria parasitica EP155]KAF3765745.1 hypothetical protein M406DRAFT_351140 [Cryphonectria parasitica EP155]